MRHDSMYFKNQVTTSQAVRLTAGSITENCCKLIALPVIGTTKSVYQTNGRYCRRVLVNALP